VKAQEEASPVCERLFELEQAAKSALEEIFKKGTRPAPDDLAGWEFRGVNAPRWARTVGIKKFCKGFYQDGEKLRGYNTPVEQNGLRDNWHPLPSAEDPKRFGFYEVTPVDASSRDNAYLQSLLLDYGKGQNPRFDPTRGLRDYLVQIDDEKEVYLGKAYYAVGPVRVPTSFFILQRWRKGITRL